MVNFVSKGNTAETNPDAQNLTLVENVSREFCENWLSKLEKLKDDCENKFGNCKSRIKILKRVMTRILEIYTTFYNIVKGSYPSFTSNMVPLHKLTIDMKNQINSLDK